MVARGTPTPARLKHDAIIEALFELRFDMKTLPEVLFGRLASSSAWKEMEQRRMPVYNIPSNIREADVDFRYQPIFELVGTNQKQTVKIGPHVLSFHVLAPYIGWQRFHEELSRAVSYLFASAESLKVTRLGLRYINALNRKIHNVQSVRDLDADLRIAGEPLEDNLNLNFSVELPPISKCMVRVATPDFVGGVLPENTAVVIDVDIFTKEGFTAHSPSDVESWMLLAHAKEKDEFFHLFPHTIIEDLKEA